ncbi:MAG TPA: CHRD domain-containing protein [Anaeromyxobacter sp.]|nr:CHRD domain-containing protein [Anaeromyxobacter sp.]
MLNTRLSPENEVRTAANTNDPTVESTATGHAQVKVRNDGTLEIKVFILNQDAETITAGHIHVGPPTANGPVVVPLFSGSFSGEHFVQHEVVAVPEAFDAFDLCDDPGAFYVNYHTTQDPVGATRGQLD